MQGEGAQAPSAGALKYGQLQDVFVQVHSNISSQFIWEVMQQLRRDRKRPYPPCVQTLSPVESFFHQALLPLFENINIKTSKVQFVTI